MPPLDAGSGLLKGAAVLNSGRAAFPSLISILKPVTFSLEYCQTDYKDGYNISKATLRSSCKTLWPFLTQDLGNSPNVKGKLQGYTRKWHPKVRQRYTGFPSSLPLSGLLIKLQAPRKQPFPPREREESPRNCSTTNS